MKLELSQILFRSGFLPERHIGSRWVVAESLCLLPLDWDRAGGRVGGW